MESGAQGVFNIAYCSQISVQELAALIMEITGISVPLSFEPQQPGDIRDSCADIHRAVDAFGYSPRYTVRSGLEETVRWYQQQPLQ
jgi:UDP-glucose 4-epimerase